MHLVIISDTLFYLCFSLVFFIFLSLFCIWRLGNVHMNFLDSLQLAASKCARFWEWICKSVCNCNNFFIQVQDSMHGLGPKCLWNLSSGFFDVFYFLIFPSSYVLHCLLSFFVLFNFWIIAEEGAWLTGQMWRGNYVINNFCFQTLLNKLILLLCILVLLLTTLHC
jgi:hypothetical protein